MNHSSDAWVQWHRPYADPDSPLSRRLRIVQAHIRAWLDANAGRSTQIVSACAGQGRDLLDVLADRQDGATWRARLIELDPSNAAIAQDAVRVAGLAGVEVVCGDAGDLDAYVGALPADLVLLCGVFGNISDADVESTVAALPALCRDGAAVVWTRSRREPDLTPQIRGWFGDAGFSERAFDAPDDAEFTVGVHAYTSPTAANVPMVHRLFSFTDVS